MQPKHLEHLIKNMKWNFQQGNEGKGVWSNIYKPSTEGLCILPAQHILFQCLMTPQSLVMPELFFVCTRRKITTSFTTTIYTVTAPQAIIFFTDRHFVDQVTISVWQTRKDSERVLILAELCKSAGMKLILITVFAIIDLPSHHLWPQTEFCKTMGQF